MRLEKEISKGCETGKIKFSKKHEILYIEEKRLTEIEYLAEWEEKQKSTGLKNNCI